MHGARVAVETTTTTTTKLTLSIERGQSSARACFDHERLTGDLDYRETNELRAN